MYDSTFSYTDLSVDHDSSWIPEIYYNANTQELAVNLENSIDDDVVWVYDNVPFTVYSDMIDSSSVGGFYNTVIKPQHGPGDELGDYYGVNFVRVSPFTTPTEVREDNGFTTDRESTYTALRTVEPVERDESGFVPKALSDKSEDNYVSLRPLAVVDGTPGRSWDVYFRVEDNDEVKSYTVEAKDILGAVEDMTTLAEMLGVNVDVVAVEVVE